MKCFAIIALLVAFASSGLAAFSALHMDHGSMHDDCGTAECFTGNMYGGAVQCALHCLATAEKQTAPAAPLFFFVLAFALLVRSVRYEDFVTGVALLKIRDPVWLFLRKREFASVIIRN